MVEKNLCEEIKRKYYEEDKYPLSLGIEIVELVPGYSVVEMEVTEEMDNFHQITHGGAVYSLADTAFGLASNSRGPAVAMQVSMNYLAPAFSGQVISAIAREEHITRSTGTYSVTVQNKKEEKIALFRGVVYRKKSN